MKETLIDYLNIKTLNKYSYLKLVDISYEKKSNKYILNFIFPRSLNGVSDDDKKEILEISKKYLNLNAKVELKIRKSYLETQILYKFISNYLLDNYPSVAQNLEENAIQIEDNGKINIKILCNSILKELAEKKNLRQLILTALDKNFCGSFNLDFIEVEDTIDEEKFLEERLKLLEKKDILDSYTKQAKKRYNVNITKKLIGEEISVMPQAISDFTKPAIGVILAGKVKFLNSKTYKSKKPNKNGEFEEKPMITFILEDRTGKINVTMFPSKTNYHKVNLLSDGSVIILKGDIQSFHDKLSLRPKSISFCERLKQEETPKDTELIDMGYIGDYNCVFPKKYIATFQENLFSNSFKIKEKLLNKEFVVFDLETTGLDSAVDQIIEIGAVKIKDGIITEVFTSLIKPTIRIIENIIEITNITNEMVADAPDVNSVLKDFYKFAKGSILIAYNIPFDYGFLKEWSKISGFVFNNEQIDALAVARERVLGLKSYKLKNVCDSVGVSLVGAHRALEDTIATAELFLRIY